ncbi:MAG: dTDP-4-dehydrorhamnose 3,5-epimerase [Phycisphaerales bacterium]|nr:dTDP-4-dehydrorhamnose 3,5-epimerase [Phycisphaerales bacterium]
MMDLIPTSLPGCYEIRPQIVVDDRGTFVKTFHKEIFEKWGLAGAFAEQFYSVSRQKVLRGLHFQLPPRDHAKLVTCISGKVLDAVVDLRKGPPTYGKYMMLELDAAKGNMIYIPSGMAHGFFTLSAAATLLYGTTTTHSPTHDSGIRWDSVGIPWPTEKPIVSPRDTTFIGLADFKSPFVFGPAR